MAQPTSIHILQYKGSRVVSIRNRHGEEFRMDYWALHDVLIKLIDIDWFKDKKPKWKYKRLNYEETYKHLLYHPAIHKLLQLTTED
jgi:hypothetical protein